MVLWDYLNCSPRTFSVDRGFDLAILSGGYQAFLVDHYKRVERARRFGIRLGLALGNPWGRGPDQVQLPDNPDDATSQRFDQKLRCAEQGFTTITQQIHDNTDPETTFLYIGSVPASTMTDEGYDEELELGYNRWAFDILTQWPLESAMFQEILALKAGHPQRDILTEANSLPPKGLPMLAFADLWENANRTSPVGAPVDSAWWWRREAEDGAWDIDRVRARRLQGLRFWVRHEQITEAQQDELWDTLARLPAVGRYSSIGGLGRRAAWIAKK